jgi:cyclophilin family peptidyl-prolyl cis-trans isomerase
MAYVNAPRENKQLAEFLTHVVSLLIANEEYEEAVRMAQMLIDNHVENAAVCNMAGMSAFVVGQFSLAEKHLEVAKQNQLLGGIGRQYLEEIAYYKDAWAREKKIRSAESFAGDLPRVLLKTTQGDIELELFENEAPNTVANFVQLVEKGFYDGLTFHRVTARFMAQAGCPKGDGTGGPGYTIRCECYRPDHRLHFRGSLSMAHSGRDTGGSQFTLTFVPIKRLDGKHTVFGGVVRGIDVLARLQRREPPAPDLLKINPHANVNVPPADKIIEARVLRKRNHPYKPEIRPEGTPILIYDIR